MDSAALRQPDLSHYMSNYQCYLKQKYMSMEFVSQFEMFDCYSPNYIELSLTDDDGDYISLSEALQLEEEERLIIFKGNPGVGKSTLAIHICKCWAKGDILQGFDAVILLPLRDPEIQEAKNIKDLLLILDDDMREGVFREIVKCNGEKICFILEGYDELPKRCTNQFSVFSKLKEKLINCTLIYTSRPVHINLPHSEAILIVVYGFKEESIDRYISSTFKSVKNGKELTDKLKSQLCNNPMVKSILHVPINLAIVCLIFFHFSTLPETLTTLYTLLCLRLILRHITTRTPNVEGIEKLLSLNDLPENISEQFFELCFLAYKGMMSKTIIFCSKDLHEIGVDERKISCLGILQIASVASVFGIQKSYNFPHLTLRDFCAAWYISKLSSDEQLKLLKATFYDEQYEMVWRFYSGITGLKDREILNCMLPYKLVKSELTKFQTIQLMYHVYEAHNDEVCRIVGDHCDGSFVDLYPEHLRFVTYSFNNHITLLQVLCYFIIYYKGVLKLIDISTWPITDRELTIIVNALETRMSQQNNVTPDKLTFKVFVKNTTHKSHSLLANLLTLQYPISEFHFINQTTVTIDTMLMCRLFTRINTLHVLDISGNKIRSEEATCLADCRNIMLCDLRMRNCGLGPVGADKIGEMLAHNKSIISIDLSGNNICDKGIERIAHHLYNGSTLQCINLSDNNITAVGIGHLRELLATNSTLISLDLSHNNLWYKDIYLFLMFLNSLSNAMEYVGLYHYGCRFIPKAIAAAHPLCKVGFFYRLDDHESLDTSEPLIAAMQQLEVCVGGKEINCRSIASIKVITQNNNIQVLEICYCFMKSEMFKDLLTFVKKSHSLKELVIDLVKCTPTIHILELFTVNTSIKKFKCIAFMSFSLLEYQELLTKLPDTLEELTLRYIRWLSKENFQKLIETIKEVNQLRSIKGTCNPLQVNFSFESAEGFY